MDARISTLIGITSIPLADYRRARNVATFGLSAATVRNANPESSLKIGEHAGGLYTQARGILPPIIVVPQISMENRSRLFTDYDRGNLQVGK